MAKKYAAEKHPLLVEKTLTKMVPPDAMKTAIKNKWFTQHISEATNPQEALAYIQQRVKLEVEALDNKIDTDWQAEFRAWICGNSDLNNPRITPWGDQPLFYMNQGVRDFLRREHDMHHDFRAALLNLQLAGTGRTLDQAYLYFKYIIEAFQWHQRYGAKSHPPWFDHDGQLKFLDMYRATTIVDEKGESDTGQVHRSDKGAKYSFSREIHNFGKMWKDYQVEAGLYRAADEPKSEDDDGPMFSATDDDDDDDDDDGPDHAPPGSANTSTSAEPEIDINSDDQLVTRTPTRPILVNDQQAAVLQQTNDYYTSGGGRRTRRAVNRAPPPPYQPYVQRGVTGDGGLDGDLDRATGGDVFGVNVAATPELSAVVNALSTNVNTLNQAIVNQARIDRQAQGAELTADQIARIAQTVTMSVAGELQKQKISAEDTRQTIKDTLRRAADADGVSLAKMQAKLDEISTQVFLDNIDRRVSEDLLATYQKEQAAAVMETEKKVAALLAEIEKKKTLEEQQASTDKLKKVTEKAQQQMRELEAGHARKLYSARQEMNAAKADAKRIRTESNAAIERLEQERDNIQSELAKTVQNTQATMSQARASITSEEGLEQAEELDGLLESHSRLVELQTETGTSTSSESTKQYLDEAIARLETSINRSTSSLPAAEKEAIQTQLNELKQQTRANETLATQTKTLIELIEAQNRKLKKRQSPLNATLSQEEIVTLAKMSDELNRLTVSVESLTAKQTAVEELIQENVHNAEKTTQSRINTLAKITEATFGATMQIQQNQLLAESNLQLGIAGVTQRVNDVGNLVAEVSNEQHDDLHQISAQTDAALKRLRAVQAKQNAIADDITYAMTPERLAYMEQNRQRARMQMLADVNAAGTGLLAIQATPTDEELQQIALARAVNNSTTADLSFATQQTALPLAQQTISSLDTIVDNLIAQDPPVVDADTARAENARVVAENNQYNEKVVQIATTTARHVRERLAILEDRSTENEIVKVLNDLSTAVIDNADSTIDLQASLLSHIESIEQAVANNPQIQPTYIQELTDLAQELRDASSAIITLRHNKRTLNFGRAAPQVTQRDSWITNPGFDATLPDANQVYEPLIPPDLSAFTYTSPAVSSGRNTPQVPIISTTADGLPLVINAEQTIARGFELTGADEAGAPSAINSRPGIGQLSRIASVPDMQKKRLLPSQWFAVLNKNSVTVLYPPNFQRDQINKARKAIVDLQNSLENDLTEPEMRTVHRSIEANREMLTEVTKLQETAIRKADNAIVTIAQAEETNFAQTVFNTYFAQNQFVDFTLLRADWARRAAYSKDGYIDLIESYKTDGEYNDRVVMAAIAAMAMDELAGTDPSRIPPGTTFAFVQVLKTRGILGEAVRHKNKRYRR